MRSVTLTFDNGPGPEVTPLVLDVLRAHGLKATFFVLGHKLAAHRAPVERARDEGHWIGNHTWSHTRPLGQVAPEQAEAEAEAEIGRTQELLGPLAHADRLFRPQGGGGALGPHLLSGAALRHLRQGGYSVVLWNAVPGDFRDADGWVDRALALCDAQDETLLVLHDLPNGAMRHLDRFLGLLRDRGTAFRQDFPEACLLLRRGVPLRPLEGYVTPGLESTLS
ncbi:polysaccharide deacetylase family protein [Pseudoroseomonas cervicalis]|uniref:polysaccharide deacetylase family protein n=1 Tax=Teichococcus cervicalis TaxID=204525 RepID=UPI00278872FB|nr:polysaccharide deacetylase family protein [Pseudoroseomonas cervicalis]MDQ1077853.1 peptidoglycan/xylan/chitin deacetylase (PgdA/CDA1 family) [Pseudoroseomonas cervicalis]